MTIQTPEIIEFLEDGDFEAVETVEDDQDILELYIGETITVVETSVPEELELQDVGPVPGGIHASAALLFIPHDGIEYPARSTVTNDPERVVVWIGPVAPTVDATYALDNVDVWWNTSV